MNAQEKQEWEVQKAIVLSTKLIVDAQHALHDRDFHLASFCYRKAADKLAELAGKPIPVSIEVAMFADSLLDAPCVALVEDHPAGELFVCRSVGELLSELITAYDRRNPDGRIELPVVT